MNSRIVRGSCREPVRSEANSHCLFLDSVRHQAMARGVRLATEWLWCNFPPPVALHDYWHLGASYRERGRIKRLK